MYKSGSATTIHIVKHMSGPTTTVLQSEIQNFVLYIFVIIFSRLVYEWLGHNNTYNTAQEWSDHSRATFRDTNFY